ncbi:MAG: YqaE/Pmp3 family membrane protein [Akkermansiaceae bacterium]
MKYLFAILLPPLAVLLCKRPFLACVNLLFTLCLWLPGIIHALFVVSSYEKKSETDRLVKAMAEGRK